MADFGHPLWGVMKTYSGATLNVAEELRGFGFEVYAPMQLVRRRIPRTMKFHWVKIPALPSFLFVPFPQVQGAEVATRGNARQIYFNSQAMIVPVGQILEMDNQINGEGKSEVHLPKPLELGCKARFTSGPLSSLPGVIISIAGDRIGIDLGGILGRVEVSAFLLERFEA